MAPDHIDAGGGGALISSCLNVNEAKNLIEKMVFNQGWSDERLQSHKQGMHIVNVTTRIFVQPKNTNFLKFSCNVCSI